MAGSLTVEWRPWRDGAYEVSSDGRVRRAKPGRRTQVGRELSLILGAVGYFVVSPVTDGKNRRHYVHRMVAECFLGAGPPGAEVNHIDGVKTNNNVENLEYVTHAENMAHAGVTGILPSGERHPGAKVTDAQVREIRDRRATGESLPSIAKDYGIARSTACQIANGTRRTS